MTPAPRDPRSFLPLTPLVFHVLLALADGPRHGYGIMLEVEDRTDGIVRLRTGTLYVLLQRLVEEGLVAVARPPRTEAAPDRTPGSPRRYYAMTPLGRAVVAAEARRLDSAVGYARRKRLLGRAQRA